VSEDVHPKAAVGFARAAGAYERGRATFPAAAVAAILAETGAAPGGALLELGTGTGKLTRSLTGSGARVIALEPVAEMRALLGETAPGAETLAGVAEQIPLADGSVDAVVAAQAYHWFDPEAATAEVARVLRPGGAVALVWNRRDERFAWMREHSDIFAGVAGDAPRYKHGTWRRGFDGSPAFAPLELRTWPQRGPAGRDVVRACVASMSFVAALDDEPRAALLAQVEHVLDTHPDTRGRDDVAIPYVTELFTTRKLPESRERHGRAAARQQPGSPISSGRDTA
jgi:SAM-dependent methyltransferase